MLYALFISPYQLHFMSFDYIVDYNLHSCTHHKLYKSLCKVILYIVDTFFNIFAIDFIFCQKVLVHYLFSRGLQKFNADLLADAIDYKFYYNKYYIIYFKIKFQTYLKRVRNKKDYCILYYFHIFALNRKRINNENEQRFNNKN